MRQQKVVRTTLGELVIAVTDEVIPLVRDPTSVYPVVSYILHDLLMRHRVPVLEQSRRTYPSYLAKALR